MTPEQMKNELGELLIFAVGTWFVEKTQEIRDAAFEEAAQAAEKLQSNIGNLSAMKIRALKAKRPA